MGSELSHKAKVTMRTLHVNLVDNCNEENKMTEDAEQTIQNVMKMCEELKTKAIVGEREKNAHQDDNMDDNNEEKGDGEENEEETRRRDFNLDVEEQDTVGDLKDKDMEGKVNLSKKHKRFSTL